jgi:chemotaxis protein histidine kinase CheA
MHLSSNEQDSNQAKISRLLHEMRLAFLDEMNERCETIEHEVLSLERSGGDRSHFDALFRSIHSLKGSGGTHGMAIISAISHQFEHFLTETAGVFNNSNSAIALRFSDLLRQAGSEGRRADPDYSPLEQQLNELTQQLLQQRKSILVVESSAMMLAIYRRALQPFTLKITLADNGMEALDHLLNEKYHLIIAGRELKRLNAIAVISALRLANCVNQHTPVILISSTDAAPPTHLNIEHSLRRDPQLVDQLSQLTSKILSP